VGQSQAHAGDHKGPPGWETGSAVTHKVKVPVLGHLPVVGEDVLGLDVVGGLLLRLIVVVLLLLLRRLVGVLLVEVVHEGRTQGLLGRGVPCSGEEGGGPRLGTIYFLPSFLPSFFPSRQRISLNNA